MTARRSVRTAKAAAQSMPDGEMLAEAAGHHGFKATIHLERLGEDVCPAVGVTGVERRAVPVRFVASVIRCDRRETALALVDVSSALLEGRPGEASALLTDVIAMLRWDGERASDED